MFNNFFINLLLLISVVFIAGHTSKDRPFNRDSKLSSKIVLGLGGGVLGIGMMVYTIAITGTKIIIDLRVMPIMLTYYIGGVIPAIITSTVIIFFRIVYYSMNYSAVVGILQILLVIPVYCFIDRFKLSSRKRWITMVLATLAVLVGTAYYLLHTISNGLHVLLIYTTFYIIAFILAYNLVQYIQSANELYRRFKNEAAKDFLTGLNNTRQFDLTFNRSIKEAVEKKEDISCLMIDIDHFKKVNDTYGHAAGDLVLKQLSSIIRNTCRQSDDVSRVGGEEFCALLTNCNFRQAEITGNRICDLVRSSNFSIGDTNIKITVSIGISAFPGNVESADELIEKADQALYRAKQTGRDRVCSISDSVVVC